MGDPLGFVPLARSSWAHRFDDPKREYRTLYCAEGRITCLRETLHGFRPNTKAIKEFQRVFGKAEGIIARVPPDWLDKQVLAPGIVELERGAFADIDDPSLRREFEISHAELLDTHGMEHLDISEIRSCDRIITQTLGRFVFDRGAAGCQYRSDLDDLSCVAVFEGRARVIADGAPEALTSCPPELLQVCKEFGFETPKCP